MEIILGPVILTLVAALLFWASLDEDFYPTLLTASLLLLIFICVWMGTVISKSELSALASFLGSIFAIGIAFLAAFFLVIMLPLRRKLFAGVIGLLFPLALILSNVIGITFSPERRFREEGKIIAHALGQYHADNGRYPETLNELVPKYALEVKQPETIWGWLYAVDGDTYSLGYVDGVDRYGYFVCVLSSSISVWDCLPNAPPIFDIPPTPMP